MRGWRWDRARSANWYPLNSNRILNADTLTVNVFGLAGPLNVPGDSTYWYDAIDGDAATGASHWNTPLGCGAIVPGPVAPVGDSGDWTRIQWGAGPTVAKLAYQASPGYVWYRNVNVVHVLVTTPAALRISRGRQRMSRTAATAANMSVTATPPTQSCQRCSGRTFA